MRCSYLLSLLILLSLIVPGSAVRAQQQGDLVTENYKAGTVRVTARFADDDSKEGFGFIVGERNRDLFLVTANHVIEKKPDRATTIEVRFAAAPDEPYLARWLQSKGHLDLALLKIDKPEFAVSWQQATWCTRFQRGDKVWFIGRDSDWFVPLDREAGELYASEPDEDDRLQFAISSVKPGTSGAPLIHANGIVGMISRDRVNDARAVAVNKIRRFVAQRGYPWQLRRCGEKPAAIPTADTPPLTTPGNIPFRVKTSPGGARVRILNIGPKYRDGIELKSGSYRIEVTKMGYKKHLSWFNLAADSRVYAVELESVSAAPPTPIKKAGTIFRDKLKEGGEGPRMVRVPKGCFRMGDIQGGGDFNEQPVHHVCLDAFAVGVTEVTFDEYDRFAAATGRSKPDDENWGRGTRPVIHVSWNDALAYTAWLSEQTGQSYRLPTEAQWEYAARAGTETKYWWGNKIGLNRANCYSCGSLWDGKQTAPVSSFEPNPFGLHDTAGNVWEWTCSKYAEKHNGSERRCIKKNVVKTPVLRGGSWYYGPRILRAAYRYGYRLDGRSGDLGFRVVRLARN